MKICIITKNKFFIDEEKLISSGLLTYEENHILGCNFNELEKIIFIGFKEEKPFDGYVYNNLGKKNNVFVVGPKWKEEEKYIIDRLINIYKIIIEIFKNKKILKDIQIIYSPFFEYTAFLLFILKLINSKSKFINYIIGDYPECNYQKKKKHFLKFVLLVFMKISILISTETWIISDYLFKKYNYGKKCIKIPFSSISNNEINLPKRCSTSIIKLLFVGRFAQEKNPHIPCLVAKKLKEKGNNIFLGMIGDGELYNSLNILCKNYFLEQEYQFYGWIKDRKELLKEISGFDFLIFPSTKGEGLGLVIIEAMSQGLVVVATKCGGLEEMIKNEFNGFLIDLAEDNLIVDRTVELIELLTKNPLKYYSISTNAIDTAKELTIEKMSHIQRQRILNLLKK
mgnify:FL=1